MNYVFLGIQGSGKGTQAKLTCNKYNYMHVNLGGLLREEVANNTDLGIAVNFYISKGLFVPDDIIISMIKKTYHKNLKGIVFDGFPRNYTQAKFLSEHFSIHKAIYLDLGDAIAKERMLARRICIACGKDYSVLFNPPKKEGVCDVCGKQVVSRADDTEILIESRIKLFNQETKPLIEFYKDLNILSVINANQEIDNVQMQIIDALNND
jgi:adenylate kinase